MLQCKTKSLIQYDKIIQYKTIECGGECMCHMVGVD